MNQAHASARFHRSPMSLALSVLATSFALASCGGGGSGIDGNAQSAATDARAMTGVGSGGTGRSLYLGPVSSTSMMTSTLAITRDASGRRTPSVTITVDSVAFATAGATVYDDEGNTRTAADLLPGASVVVDAGPVANDHATASAVEITSDLIGSTDAPFDATTSTLRVMGQPVVVGAGTALDGVPGGLAALPPGSIVEVSSTYDPITGNYVATRIDLRPLATHFKARGVATSVDSRARTFRIGTQTFSYLHLPPVAVANGKPVAVDLLTTRNALGQWVVTGFLAPGVSVAEGTNLGITGVAVSVSDPAHFVVAGMSVDASRAVVLPKGATVAPQSRVEVRGVVMDDEVAADRVTVLAAGDHQTPHVPTGDH